MSAKEVARLGQALEAVKELAAKTAHKMVEEARGRIDLQGRLRSARAEGEAAARKLTTALLQAEAARVANSFANDVVRSLQQDKEREARRAAGAEALLDQLRGERDALSVEREELRAMVAQAWGQIARARQAEGDLKSEIATLEVTPRDRSL